MESGRPRPARYQSTSAAPQSTAPAPQSTAPRSSKHSARPPKLVLAPPTYQPVWKRWFIALSVAFRPWVISISFNLGVLIAFASVAFQAQEQEILSVTAAPVDSEEAINSFEYSLEPAEFEDLSQSASGGVELSDLPSLEQPVIDNELRMLQSSDMFASVSGLGTMGGGEGPEQGQGESKVGLESRGTSFYGVEATGQSFVYILDNSGSMRGIRWQEARDELIRSLSQLDEEQQFMVLLYNSRPNIMLNLRGRNFQFLRATDENRAQVIRWLTRQQPDGNTMPLTSVKLALSLKPDSVFLLSDGLFQDNTVGFLGQLTEKPVVHTFAYKSPFGAGFLQRIALDSGGEFRQIQ